jgi:hypothetical protein
MVIIFFKTLIMIVEFFALKEQKETATTLIKPILERNFSSPLIHTNNS